MNKLLLLLLADYFLIRMDRKIKASEDKLASERDDEML